eukprot:COSAG01_NODE_3461_length_6067_cov_55.078418_5_plen_448_part_00
MKREVKQLIEQGRYDEVSALTVQLKAAELELGRGRSPMAAGGGDELTRQRSDQEREALAIALEEQAMAEAEEAQLAGELSRTRAAFAAELSGAGEQAAQSGMAGGHGGYAQPMLTGDQLYELRQMTGVVFGVGGMHLDGTPHGLQRIAALDDWDGAPMPQIDDEGPVQYLDDLVLSPLSAEDTESLRRAVGSVRVLSARAGRSNSRGAGVRGITTPMARLTPDTARIRALGGGGAMMMDALLPTVSIDTPLPDGAALLPAERTPYSMEHLWGQPSIMEEDLPDYAHGAAGGGGGGGRGRAPPPAPEPLLGSEGLRSARGRMFSQRGPSIIPGEPVRLEPTAEGLELEDEEANFSWAEALKRAAAPPPPPSSVRGRRWAAAEYGASADGAGGSPGAAGLLVRGGGAGHGTGQLEAEQASGTQSGQEAAQEARGHQGSEPAQAQALVGG